MATIEGSYTGEHVISPGEEFQAERRGGQFYRKATIGALPNDVLLDIFNFFVDLPQPHYPFSTPDDASFDTWHTLIHVCQQWRHVVFASPRSLNLRLHCTNRTPTRTMLSVWPAFPIIVFCHRSPGLPLRGVRNIIAALKCRDRVCEICLWGVPNSLLKRFGALRVPFPELKSIQLSSSDDRWPPVLPESFLGGSAPRLQSLDLYGIPFPVPQKLLLSTADLVILRLDDIPGSGYVSPENITTCLSALTKLEQFALGFRYPLHHGHYTSQHHSPLLSRIVLPVLTSLRFRGDCNYLKSLVFRISTPLLNNLDLTFIQPVTNDNVSQLRQFISCNEAFEAPDCADLAIYKQFVNVTLSRQEGTLACGTLKLAVLCNLPYRQLLSLTQLCSLSLHSLSTLEHLYIRDLCSLHHWQYYYPESFEWLELLRPFTSVKNLHVSKNLALRVMLSLKELSEQGVIEVLPTLQNVFLPGSQPFGPIAEANAQLAAARALSGRPVSVHYN